MRVLVGDVGGTHTRIAVAEIDGDQVALTGEGRFPSRDFAGLGEILTAYLRQLDDRTVVSGAFAIAGPVADGRSRATNLPWVVDCAELEAATALQRVRLLNDLEAIAWGIGSLSEDQVVSLQEGDPSALGNAAVVAPGTGLGQAGLFWDGQQHRPFATEGGHTDFAPTDALEFALLGSLQQRFGRVSWERVVSGMGIENLYHFLCNDRGGQHHPQVREVIDGKGDLAAAVAERAGRGDCPLCVETMDIFAVLLGREAGNTALKLMARSGVYLAGGIAPKNLPLLQRGGFLEGFLDKGRMRPLLEAMPVRVVLDERTPLRGAGRFLGSG